jgi:hypothetical protein
MPALAAQRYHLVCWPASNCRGPGRLGKVTHVQAFLGGSSLLVWLLPNLESYQRHTVTLDALWAETRTGARMRVL